MAVMEDGFSTIITFSENSTIAFYEKTVTPPGISGGGSNDVTTMRNTAWRTFAPKKLKTLTDVSAEVAYDPAVYSSVVTMCNINQSITVTFPDGDTLVFYGWLDEFTPNANEEGSQPTANITIIMSNRDETGQEVGPTYTAATTTTTAA